MPDEQDSAVKNDNSDIAGEQPTTVSGPTNVSNPIEQPAVTSAQPAVLPVQTKSRRKSTKLLIPMVFAGFLVLGGGAAAYIQVFQKSPEKLWQRSLSTTQIGLERLSEQSMQADPGFTLDGSFAVKQPIAADGSMKGAWLGANGSMNAEIAVSGVTGSMEMRTIKPENAETPDVYMKVSGLEAASALAEAYLGAQGSSAIDELNDQWFSVDHTLIDQYLTSAQQQAGSSAELTQEDAQEFVNAVLAVFKDRLFTDDPAKAVLTLDQEVGKEDFEGDKTYKVVASVNKDRFKEFITALKDGVKDTKYITAMLEDTDQTLDEFLAFDDLLASIEEADFSKAKADVWIESNGKFIRNVRIYPVEDSKATNYIDFGLPYKGGDVLPLLIRLTLDDGEAKGVVSLGADINQKNGDARMWFNADVEQSGQNIEAEGQLTINGSDATVTVEKPEGARNILELSELLAMPFGATVEEDFSTDFDSLDYDFQYDDTEL